MLHSIKIKNIALIDDITVEFKDGLNVLTGQTGAGKSIIIDALNFLLGARADKTLIRSGKEEAMVTGVFFASKPQEKLVESFFEKNQLEFEDTIIITRQMNLAQKSSTKINGEFVTASMLRELTSLLIDLHGQNEHQFLLNETNQLKLIDDFAAADILPIKENYLKKLNALKDIKEKIKSLGGSKEERERELELLEYQLKELESASLMPQEEEELVLLLKKMQNLEKITNSVGGALSSINHSGGGALNALAQAISSLGPVSGYDKDIALILDRLTSAKLELEDISSTLEGMGTSLDFDQEEFNRVDSRLDQIRFLKRKYVASTVEEVLEHLQKIEKRLYDLKNSKQEMQKFEKEKEVVLKELLGLALELRGARKKSFNLLSVKVLEQLKDLGMEKSKLELDFSTTPTIDNIESLAKSSGADEVEFLFCANLGEALKPLSKIISGGEMSRFMLALKVVVSNSDNIGVMVFDEIDTGVSGKMAQVIAQKMAAISKERQVLVVTHLPQIAAMADYHYYIEKIEENQKTHTIVVELDKEGQIKEIAKMLSGNLVNEASIENAKALKQEGNLFKHSLLT